MPRVPEAGQPETARGSAGGDIYAQRLAALAPATGSLIHFIKAIRPPAAAHGRMAAARSGMRLFVPRFRCAKD